MRRVGEWLRAAWYVICLVGAGIAAAVSIAWYRRRRDAAAAGDNDEAAKVEEAGKRGDADAVLSSFDKATKS